MSVAKPHPEKFHWIEIVGLLLLIWWVATTDDPTWIILFSLPLLGFFVLYVAFILAFIHAKRCTSARRWKAVNGDTLCLQRRLRNPHGLVLRIERPVQPA